MRISHSTSSLQSYFQNSADPKNLSIRNFRSDSKSPKKGGIIHVNSHNLTYLNTDDNVKDNGSKNDNDGFMFYSNTTTA
jgi:hypothetical protein